MLFVYTFSLTQDTLVAISPVVSEAVALDSLVFNSQAIKVAISTIKDEPSWTDKAQAYAAIFGTVVAVVAGILAWLSYRSTIKQQQDQINDQQTQITKLGAIAERLELQYMFDRKKRRQDIKPHFEDDGIRMSIDEEYEPYFLKLKNRGERAINLRLLVPDDAPLEFCGFRSNLITDKGDTIRLKFKPLKSTKHKGTTMKFNLLFEDVDKNQYSQVIVRDNYDNYTVKEPSLVNEVHPE